MQTTPVKHWWINISPRGRSQTCIALGQVRWFWIVWWSPTPTDPIMVPIWTLSSFLSLQAGQDLKLCQPTICMSFMLCVEAGQPNTAFTVQLFLGMGWWCWTHVQVLGAAQAVPWACKSCCTKCHGPVYFICGLPDASGYDVTWCSLMILRTCYYTDMPLSYASSKMCSWCLPVSYASVLYIPNVVF